MSFLVLICIAIITNCMSITPFNIQNKISSSNLYLQDDMIASSSGNLEKLEEIWIRPRQIYNNGYFISFTDYEDHSLKKRILHDGFTRFCAKYLGKISEESTTYGYILSCNSQKEGKFMGKMFVVGGFKPGIVVNFDTPSKRLAEQKKQDAFDEDQKINGPTGTILTNRGEFEVIRFGNLNERHQIQVQTNNEGPSNYIPIEEITSIESKGRCCDVIVETSLGEKLSVNVVNILHKRDPNGFEHKRDFSVVLIDKKTLQPYTMKLEFFSEIISIKIDQDHKKWSRYAGGKINSNLTIKEFVPDYISSLRAKAKSLITTAKAKGWTDLFHGGRFSAQNMNFLKRKLIDMKNYQWVWKSTGNVQQGFTENDLKCVVAGHELKLVFDSGYTMSPNLTPLSLVVLLEKIENDMQL